MKRIALFLAALLAFSLTGCSSSEASSEAPDADKAGTYEVIPPEDGRGDLIPASSDVATIPVLVGGGLPFTGMENLMNTNYEDGTYTYEDMTQDGSVLVVDMAFQSLRTNETVEEYAEYAARFSALDTGEGEPYDITCFQDEDYTRNLSYPVYIVWYTTGSGEDQRQWMVYTVDTEDYTYLYAFGTIADEADDMQDVFFNICGNLELVD